MTDESPRRWLLLSRETPVSPEDGAASWYVDHLYVDQDAIPTLVEGKRSSDTRIRREVVGQMFDYAANGVARWTVDQLKAGFLSGPNASEDLDRFLEGADAGEFWSHMGMNLASGRIRMVFVADVIPPELRRVVDFLAGQLKSAEVFAVEVRNFQGQDLRALVPRLVSVPKSSIASAPAGRQWNEPSFFEALAQKGPERVEVARQLFRWAQTRMPDFWYGKGSTAGSCIPRVILPDSRLLLFAMWTYGNIEMQFQHLHRPPFDNLESRRELLARLNAIPGLALPSGAETRRPAFDMLLLQSEPNRLAFQSTMEWAISEVMRASNQAPAS